MFIYCFLLYNSPVIYQHIINYYHNYFALVFILYTDAQLVS